MPVKFNKKSKSGCDDSQGYSNVDIDHDYGHPSLK